MRRQSSRAVTWTSRQSDVKCVWDGWQTPEGFVNMIKRARSPPFLALSYRVNSLGMWWTSEARLVNTGWSGRRSAVLSRSLSNSPCTVTAGFFSNVCSLCVKYHGALKMFPMAVWLSLSPPCSYSPSFVTRCISLPWAWSMSDALAFIRAPNWIHLSFAAWPTDCRQSSHEWTAFKWY